MVALLTLGVGCDTGDNNLPTKPVEEECYIGTLSVDQNDGTFYYQDEVKTTYEIVGDRLNFVMYKVKFATGMPLKLNMFVDGVDYTEEEGTYTLSGNGLVPHALGGPFEEFTITNLSGRLTEENFTLEFICGDYPVTYTGKMREP